VKSARHIKFSEAEPPQLQRHFQKLKQHIQIETPSRAKLKAEVQHFTFGMFNIWQGRFSCPMELTFPEPPDSICLLVPLNGSIAVNSAPDDFHGTPGTLTVVNFSALRKICFSEEANHIGLAFRSDAAVRKLSALIGGPIVRDLAFSAQMVETDKAAIFDIIKFMWSQAKSSSEHGLCPSYFERMFVTVLSYILHNVPHGYQSLLKGEGSPAIPRHIKKACTYIQDNLAEAVAAKDIAAYCNVSVRSLQSAFRRFKNRTPMEFVTEMRLLRARRLLETASDVSIAEIARGCGFNHPGRFASIYKSAYGELPNETLDAARIQFLGMRKG